MDQEGHLLRQENRLTKMKGWYERFRQYCDTMLQNDKMRERRKEVISQRLKKMEDGFKNLKQMWEELMQQNDQEHGDNEAMLSLPEEVGIVSQDETVRVQQGVEGTVDVICGEKGKEPVKASKRGRGKGKETVSPKEDWGGPRVDGKIWMRISSGIMVGEPNAAEELRLLRHPVAWASPALVDYGSPMHPKIIQEESVFDDDEKITQLNNAYFGPSMPMGILGHRAVLIPGLGGDVGSSWYRFKHEGGFLINEHWLECIGIRLPFTDFEMEVLNCINCCPAQLHPNSWRLLAILQCMAVKYKVRLSARVLFYAYQVEVSRGWVSLKSVGDKNRYNILSRNASKVKKWQDRHFFVQWVPNDRQPWYVDAEGVPRFPLWWSLPFEKIKVEMGALTEWERCAVDKLKGAGVQDGNKWKALVNYHSNLRWRMELFEKAVMASGEHLLASSAEVIEGPVAPPSPVPEGQGGLVSEGTPQASRKRRRLMTDAGIDEGEDLDGPVLPALTSNLSTRGNVLPAQTAVVPAVAGESVLPEIPGVRTELGQSDVSPTIPAGSGGSHQDIADQGAADFTDLMGEQKLQKMKESFEILRQCCDDVLREDDKLEQEGRDEVELTLAKRLKNMEDRLKDLKQWWDKVMQDDEQEEDGDREDAQEMG